MAWLAKLDARSLRWPVYVQAVYYVVKWTLVFLGAWCLIVLWYNRLVLNKMW